MIRDFRLRFFHESVSLGPLLYSRTLEVVFYFFPKIREDIRHCRLFTSVKDISNELWTVFHDNAINVLPVSLTLAITPCSGFSLKRRTGNNFVMPFRFKGNIKRAIRVYELRLL